MIEYNYSKWRQDSATTQLHFEMRTKGTQTQLVPKGHQNEICHDLENNGLCQTVIKGDKEMQPAHNGKFLIKCKPGMVTVNKMNVLATVCEHARKYLIIHA